MKGFFKFLLWTAVILAIAYGLARWLLVDFAEVHHNDMAPTLAMGDSFAIYRHATPEIGDVMVCENPREPEHLFVGRLVGKPGDTVAIRRGMLVLNGTQLDTDVPSPATFRLVDRAAGRDVTLRRHREFLGEDAWIVSMKETQRPLEMRQKKVESGYFLLADNRSFGTDSRHLGELNAAQCRGVAFFLLTTGEGNGDLDLTASDRSFTAIP